MALKNKVLTIATMGVGQLSMPQGVFTELLEFMPLDEADFTEEAGTVTSDDLLFKNKFIVGLVVGATTAKALNKKLKTVLPEHLREEGVFTVSDARDDAKLNAWLEGRIGAAVGAMTGAFFRSQQALSETRRRNHVLQNNLSSLENAFASFGYPGRKVSFQTTDKMVFALDVKDEGDEIGFVQKIPVHLSNVIGLALFFRRDGRGLSGDLNIRVIKQFSHEVVCDLTVEFENVGRGWNEFECAPKEFERPEPLTVELTISGDDADKIMPALSRGASSIRDRAHLKSGRALSYPLALRVFSGLAGLPYKRNTPADAITAAVPELKNILSAEILAAAQRYEFPYEEQSFKVVDFDNDVQSLLVHPLGLAPVVALVKKVKVPTKCLIACVIEHRNELGTPVDFGIYVAKNSLRPPSFSKSAGTGTSPSKDGSVVVDPEDIAWVRLNGGEWSELETKFSYEGELEAEDMYVDIFLLTRSPLGKANLAWAMFRNISITAVSN